MASCTVFEVSVGSMGRVILIVCVSQEVFDLKVSVTSDPSAGAIEIS